MAIHHATPPNVELRCIQNAHGTFNASNGTLTYSVLEQTLARFGPTRRTKFRDRRSSPMTACPARAREAQLFAFVQPSREIIGV